MPILETDALTRLFGEHTAVDGVSLPLDAGESFGLLGPKGKNAERTASRRTGSGLEKGIIWEMEHRKAPQRTDGESLA